MIFSVFEHYELILVGIDFYDFISRLLLSFRIDWQDVWYAQDTRYSSKILHSMSYFNSLLGVWKYLSCLMYAFKYGKTPQVNPSSKQWLKKLLQNSHGQTFFVLRYHKKTNDISRYVITLRLESKVRSCDLFRFLLPLTKRRISL